MSARAFVLLSALFLLFSGTVFANDYTVDKDHSHAGFKVRHIISKLPGEFKEFEGTFSFDPKKLDTAHGKFIIQTKSISTNNEKRDDHLRSPDFFDAAKYSDLTFESKKMTPAGKNKYKLLGDLTIRGVTKPVTFQVEYMGTAKDPWGNNRAAFSATTKINRKDFGVNWNKTLDNGGLLVGDDVELELNVEAIEKVAETKKADAKK